MGAHSKNSVYLWCEADTVMIHNFLRNSNKNIKFFSVCREGPILKGFSVNKVIQRSFDIKLLEIN